MNLFYEMSRIGKSLEKENRLVGLFGPRVGTGDGEWLIKGKGFLYGMMKIF